MKNKQIPEGFIPMVTIGEQDGYLMMFTTEDHEYTLELIETTATMLRGSDKDQGMTLQQKQLWYNVNAVLY